MLVADDPSFDPSKGKSQFTSGPVSSAIHTIPVTSVRPQGGLGGTAIPVGRQSVGQDDASDAASYVLDELPTAPGRATDTRLQADSRLAQRAGILTSEEGAHMGHLLAGSNIGARCQASPTFLDNSGTWGQGLAGTAGPVSHAVAASNRPILPLVDFKRRSDVILTEYFSSYSLAEAAQAFSELLDSAPFFSFEFVYRAIRRALEKSDQDREMVCRLLARLASLGMGQGGSVSYGSPGSPPRTDAQQQSSGQGSSSRAPSPSPSPTRSTAGVPPPRHSLTMKAVGQGMERCLECIEDIAVDVPKAREMLARFLARAVADELLPPAYLDDPAIAARAPDVCAAAQALLAQPHAGERLEHAWSITGADDIDEMKACVAAAIREYFVRCVLVQHLTHSCLHPLPAHSCPPYPTLPSCVDAVMTSVGP